MSSSKSFLNNDVKTSDPIIGHLLICVNSSPVLRRSVTASQKTDVSTELAQLTSQLWKVFDAASSITLEFCSHSCDKRDIIVNFTR